MTFVLPKLQDNWPYAPVLQPNYASIASASEQWLDSFHLFSPKQLEKFHSHESGLLVGMAYAQLSDEHLQTACNHANVIFAVDDMTDLLDGQDVQSLIKVCMDALR